MSKSSLLTRSLTEIIRNKPYLSGLHTAHLSLEAEENSQQSAPIEADTAVFTNQAEIRKSHIVTKVPYYDASMGINRRILHQFSNPLQTQPRIGRENTIFGSKNSIHLLADIPTGVLSLLLPALEHILDGQAARFLVGMGVLHFTLVVTFINFPTPSW